MKKFVNFFFFGNYFYGCCSIALAAEAGIQQYAPVTSILFYLLLFCGTVVFYTYAYIQEKSTTSINIRSSWYIRNNKFVKVSQVTLIILSAAIAIYLAVSYHRQLHNISATEMAMAAIVVFIALAYYGIPVDDTLQLNIRNTGWLKPFVIGFVWASLVTYIPLLWYQVEQDTPYIFTTINLWFFIKNFMFISVLAILFDIKDFAADHNQQLKTFVVRAGIQKTIFLVIIPLTGAGFLALILFATRLQFPAIRVAVNCIPFILLLLVALSTQRQKPIIYYLAVIDGLMLVKALCGIAASLLSQ